MRRTDKIYSTGVNNGRKDLRKRSDDNAFTVSVRWNVFKIHGKGLNLTKDFNMK